MSAPTSPQWVKESHGGSDHGYRCDGFYVGKTPKKWWHLYAQCDDGSWRHVCGGFRSAEDAMAAVDTREDDQQ